MPSTHPARGTRDFLPDDTRRRTFVVDTIRAVYERYGFEPLETPAFENLETLTGKYGEEGNRLIFKILKRGEQEAAGAADLALRYDLTVPLARVVAQYQSTLPKFFKRYQIQPVWRADRPARGRFREFYQCDIDAIGSRSLVVEVELLSAASEVLASLGFRDFVLRLNHRLALSAMLEALGIPPALHGDALVALDKLDKIGTAGVAEELAARGVPAPAVAASLAFLGGLDPAAPPDRVVSALRDLVAGRPEGERAVRDLEQIVAVSAGTPAGGRIRIDLSLARGLSYYTGAIMEVAVPDLAGSLGGGGRYDDLIGMFLGRPMPACGFSLGLERILVVMGERQMFPPETSRGAADVMVALWSEATAGDALSLARTLRASDLRVDVYPEPDKPGKQFKYAAGRQYHVVALAGEDEQRDGTVTIKNLGSGQQVTVPRADLVRVVTEELTRARALGARAIDRRKDAE
jgi:histidyl-tRNA synthetase